MSGLESYNFENENFELFVASANDYYAKGQLELARKNYYEALLHPHKKSHLLFEIYKNLGNIEIRLSDFDAAEENYNRAYMIEPQSSTLHVNFGSLAILKGNLARAVESFRKAVELDPNNAKGWAGLATVHRDFSDYELAWANAERALDIDPTLQVVIHLVADWAIRDNEVERSIRLIERYVKYQPSDLDMKVTLAQFNYFLGRLDIAESLVKEAIQRGAVSEKTNSLFATIRKERAFRDTRFK